MAQEELANSWLNGMPEAALEVVRNNRLSAGADLVKVAFEFGRPSCKENFH